MWKSSKLHSSGRLSHVGWLHFVGGYDLLLWVSAYALLGNVVALLADLAATNTRWWAKAGVNCIQLGVEVPEGGGEISNVATS